MNPIVIALIFSIVVVGGTYWVAVRLSTLTIRKMNEQIRSLAAALGLSEPKKIQKTALSAFYVAELEGEIEGRRFFFTQFTRSAQKSSAYITEFSWACQRRYSARLVIAKEGIITTFSKQFGLNDIHVDEDDFDQTFLIRCDDEVYAQKFLNPAIRQELLRWQKQMHGTFIIHHNEVHYEEPGVMIRERDMKRMLRMVELGKTLAKAAEELDK